MQDDRVSGRVHFSPRAVGVAMELIAEHGDDARRIATERLCAGIAQQSGQDLDLYLGICLSILETGRPAPNDKPGEPRTVAEDIGQHQPNCSEHTSKAAGPQTMKHDGTK